MMRKVNPFYEFCLPCPVTLPHSTACRDDELWSHELFQLLRGPKLDLDAAVLAALTQAGKEEVI